MAFQYSMSGSKLKQYLLSNLKSTCTYKHIMKFCNLLVSAQELVGQSKNKVSEGSDPRPDLVRKFDAIFKQIREVIDAVSVEDLIEKLSEALREKIKPEDVENLRSFWLETNDCDSLEYLEGLLNSINHVVKLNFNSNLYKACTSKYCEPLNDVTELVCYVRLAANRSAANSVGVLLHVYISEGDILTKEKYEWRDLLVEAVDLIKQYVQAARGCYSMFTYVLEIRSALQCALDLIKDCHIKHPNESDALKKLNDCTSTLDRIIEQRYEGGFWSTDSDLSYDEEISIINDQEGDISEDDVAERSISKDDVPKRGISGDDVARSDISDDVARSDISDDVARSDVSDDVAKSDESDTVDGIVTDDSEPESAEMRVKRFEKYIFSMPDSHTWWQKYRSNF